MNLCYHGRALVVSLVAFFGVAGCSTVSHFEAVQPGTSLLVKGSDKQELPRSEKLSSRSTGQIEFAATSPTGKTLYGILPLKVSGQKMAGSILFFAPALFIGGFRDALPAYQLDPDSGTIQFKRSEDDEWRLYKPSAAESDRAKSYFDQQ